MRGPFPFYSILFLTGLAAVLIQLTVCNKLAHKCHGGKVLNLFNIRGV